MQASRRIEVIQGFTVLTVEGTPEEMGTAHGRLLGPTVRRVVDAMIHEGIGRDSDAYGNMLRGSRVI